MNLKWTKEQRIAVASKLLCSIQSDIYDGHYSDPGNPNLTTVMHVLNSEPDLLNTSPELLSLLNLGPDQITRDCLPRGFFIAIEGGDLVGKSVQSELLSRRLASQPSTLHPLPNELVLTRSVHLVSFPDYESCTGRLIDDYLHGRSFGDEDTRELGDDALVFQCLQMVDKYALVPRILGELSDGISVVSCRWWPSALVYGVDDGLDKDWLMSGLSMMPDPDVMILLDGEPEKMAARMKKREDKTDRFDLDMEKQKRIVTSYRDLWKQHSNESSWQVVNADGDLDKVAERTFDSVCKGLGL